MNPKGELWTFNGNDEHCSWTFNGLRVSLICFCHSSWRQASKEQLASLRELEFGIQRGQQEKAEEKGDGKSEVQENSKRQNVLDLQDT